MRTRRNAMTSLVQRLRLVRRALSARRRAARAGVPGMAFDRYGRSIGLRLILNGQRREGWRYLLNPVSTFRYWEFDVADRAVLGDFAAALDVGSPRLFSLYQAERRPAARIAMLNPDPEDMGITVRVATSLGVSNLWGRVAGVDVIEGEAAPYDVVWSISVVEHVGGAYDDTHAMTLMFDALRSGGTLIVTVPVDRNFYEEHRHRDHYSMQLVSGESSYFFQRVYDEAAIRKRLLAPLSAAADITLHWYGEVDPGRFRRHEAAWAERDLEVTVDDPVEMALGYRVFPSWSAMPGFGVCAIVAKKT